LHLRRGETRQRCAGATATRLMSAPRALPSVPACSHALDGARRLEGRPGAAGRLREREIERRPHRHVHERRLALDRDGEPGVREARLDPAEPPLDGHLDAGRQGRERPRDHSAPARLAPRERRPIEEDNLDARPGEDERGGPVEYR